MHRPDLLHEWQETHTRMHCSKTNTRTPCSLHHQNLTYCIRSKHVHENLTASVPNICTKTLSTASALHGGHRADRG